MAPRKSFKGNPADMFIGPAQEETAAEEESTSKKQIKKKSLPNQKTEDEKHVKYVPTELRDRRVQLLMTQSLYDQARAVADEKGISFNEFVSESVEEAVNRN